MSGQEALDVGELVPPRSILGRLRGPVWGIDPSVERVALGILAPGREPVAHTLSLAQGGAHPGVRLAKAQRALEEWFEGLSGLGTPAFASLAPHAVAIEEPYGGARTQTPVQSLMLCGAILAAVWSTFGIRTELLRQEKKKGGWSHIGVGPTTWKSQALGAGNGFAKKPAISAWAMRACGWPGPGPTRPQDEADALGIATWAAMQVVGRRA